MAEQQHTYSDPEHDDLLVFAEETSPPPSTPAFPPWKVMIVDDEEGVHRITQRVLEDFVFEDRPLMFLNAYTGEEAIRLIQEHPDTALILLDVVMESEHAGLEVVRYIRRELHNDFVRILLRTGQPGQAPERSVIVEYDINDYKLKSTLTDQGLYTMMVSGLRAYRDLKIIEQQHQELERAMEEAQIAQKARLQFLANIGHELRTPLNGILGFAEILLMSQVNDKQRQYIERIKKAGWSLSEVLNNVLELTEIVEGRLILHETAFSLRKLIHEVMDILTVQAQWKDLRLSSHIASDIPDTVVSDPERLKQVLMNLIVNAIKHTDEGGEISLNISRFEARDALHLLFSVSDTGVGIAPDLHDTIFEPFALGEEVMKKRFAGAGLGLAISKDLIEKMNGHIWLESEPQQGSIFYFSMTFKTAVST